MQDHFVSLSTTMSFQYASDLHLEFGTPLQLTPSAPFLLLAGDIGDPFSAAYWTALEWCSIKWERLFLITGNHEYYQRVKTIDEVDKYIRAECAKRFTNVHFLQQDSWTSPDGSVHIHGCTLWSFVSPRNAFLVQHSINDYRLIPEFRNVRDSNGVHHTHLAWLIETLAKPTTATTVTPPTAAARRNPSRIRI